MVAFARRVEKSAVRAFRVKWVSLSCESYVPTAVIHAIHMAMSPDSLVQLVVDVEEAVVEREGAIVIGVIGVLAEEE